MIKSLLFDFSYVLLFPKDKSYFGTLNGLYQELNSNQNKYFFWNYFELNVELLDFLRTLRIPKDIFTSGKIQNDPEILEILESEFSNIYSAETLSLPKYESKSYLELAKLLFEDPQEILFIDDDSKNITAAEKAGLKVLKFENNQQIIKELHKFVI